MAPIKFEENIREKLQEREIQPSKEAWAALSGKLGHVSEYRSNKRMWMAVAAGFIGLLVVVSYVWTTGGDTQPIQLVDENITIPAGVQKIIKTSQFEDNSISNTTEIASEIINNDLEKSVIKDENIMIPKKAVAVTIAKESLPQKNTTIELTPLMKKEGIAAVGIELKEIPNEKAGTNKEELFVKMKVEDVVASVREMEASNNTITVAEIDKLLSTAQRDIATNRILASSNKKIDPSALLQDVESEMERSFRDKVFEALGEGYNKVRTAVVERNN